MISMSRIICIIRLVAHLVPVWVSASSQAGARCRWRERALRNVNMLGLSVSAGPCPRSIIVVIFTAALNGHWITPGLGRSVSQFRAEFKTRDFCEHMTSLSSLRFLYNQVTTKVYRLRASLVFMDSKNSLISIISLIMLTCMKPSHLRGKSKVSIKWWLDDLTWELFLWIFPVYFHI